MINFFGLKLMVSYLAVSVKCNVFNYLYQYGIKKADQMLGIGYCGSYTLLSGEGRHSYNIIVALFLYCGFSSYLYNMI